MPKVRLQRRRAPKLHSEMLDCGPEVLVPKRPKPRRHPKRRHEDILLSGRGKVPMLKKERFR